MSSKNSSAVQNIPVRPSDSLQHEVVQLETYRTGKEVVESENTPSQAPYQGFTSSTFGEAEVKGSSGTIDDHLVHALANLEVELDIVQEVKRNLEATRDRINQLNEQLQKAKRETEEARSDLNALRIVEARTKAESGVIQAERLRIEAEICQTKPLIEQLQQQVTQAGAELHGANAKLKAAKATRDQERADIEKAKQALYVTAALESQILAEIESAHLSTERDRRQTQEIQNRLEALQSQLENERSEASQAYVELQQARIAEAKVQVSQSEIPGVRAEVAAKLPRVDDQRDMSLSLQITDDSREVAESLPQLSETESQSEIGTLSTVIDTEQPHEAIQIPPKLAELLVDPDAPVIPSKIVKNPVFEEESTDQQTDESTPLNKPESAIGPADQIPNLPEEPEDAEDAPVNTAEMVYNLADAGYQVDEISRATNIAQGQVELLLKMRSLKLAK